MRSQAVTQRMASQAELANSHFDAVQIHCVYIPDESLLMWDDKSTESVDTFPNAHLQQFNRSIRASVEQCVTHFTALFADVDPEVQENRLRLKCESQQGADLCAVCVKIVVASELSTSLVN
ncbi:hypothetical protein FIV42_15660 [Persicimonas caeni]|uniref:Uncharacterized protein n=1 Tax=Persicimonas caeni TaxID=2292766 RepID=A0A4Y6PUW3_PERCE|nr:hypothetical protein [Persicimonas caeni]QDG52126.1 hypothetical protein FIV42_15660 [Persicimonas caeni]QED33348.1 hypothetical protein FRD00_15655 [Persicimonas caeni]